MTTTRKERQDELTLLEKELNEAQGFVLAGYAGMKTPEFNDLRGKLRSLNSRCLVVKNTLARIALKGKGIEGVADLLKEQTALVLQKGDTIPGLKVLVEFQKSHANWKIRAGYMDGRVLQAAEIKAVASLPTKNVLLAQMLAGFQGPVQGLAGVFSAPLRYLASALDQVAKKKESASG